MAVQRAPCMHALCALGAVQHRRGELRYSIQGQQDFARQDAVTLDLLHPPLVFQKGEALHEETPNALSSASATL